MRVEAVDTPSLRELRAIVAQRLQAYGAFDGCTAEDRRAVLAQACLVIWYLTAGNEGRTMYLRHLAPSADGVSYQGVLDTITRLCPDVIAAVQGYIAAWRTRFRQDGWAPHPMGGVLRGPKWDRSGGVRHRHAAASPGGLRAGCLLTVGPADLAVATGRNPANMP